MKDEDGESERQVASAQLERSNGAGPNQKPLKKIKRKRVKKDQTGSGLQKVMKPSTSEGKGAR